MINILSNQFLYTQGTVEALILTFCHILRPCRKKRRKKNWSCREKKKKKKKSRKINSGLVAKKSINPGLVEKKNVGHDDRRF